MKECDRRDLYRAVFGSPEGQKVLRDLEALYRDVNLHMPGSFDGTAKLLGRRDVVMFIEETISGKRADKREHLADQQRQLAAKRGRRRTSVSNQHAE